MPSPTDFNLTPYYDDFTESKKFHRVLYRPSFAVQARELTQSQTILQNQIERVSDHLFKQGAMIIPGQVGLDIKYYAVKLSAKSLSTLSSYNNVQVTGATSGVVATIINTVATDGTDPDTVYVKYEKTGTNNTTAQFSDGETLNCTVDGVAATLTVDTTAVGSAVSVKQGVYYINGFHVQVTDQTLILDKYTATPSYRVGFSITESFVTPNDDTSLNDNAAGTSNVNAPGAHRFKIELTLAKKTLTSTEDSNFFEVMRVEEGIVTSKVRATEYNVLEDTLARRTFDESGDYVLTNSDFDVREHLISGNDRGILTSGNGGTESKLALTVVNNLTKQENYEEKIEILSVTSSVVEQNITKLVEKAVENVQTDEDMEIVTNLVENSKGTLSNKVLDSANNNEETKKKVSEVIVNIVEKNPEKAVEIIENNQNTNTVTETIKTKIENNEAVTTEDFEEVFDTNVSPN